MDGITEASKAELGSLEEETFNVGYSFIQIYELLWVIKLKPPGPNLAAWRRKGLKTDAVLDNYRNRCGW